MSNLATIVNNILADSGIDDINVIVSTGSYNNPSWITALSWTKITDAPSFITGTGTSGQVAYFNGTNSVTGESNLFWDAANDRLGIGTNAPGYSLDVRGNVSLSGVSGGSRFIILGQENSSYTGNLVIQAGQGSAGFGGGVVLYGHSHATYPGSVWIGRSSGSTGSILFGTGGIGVGAVQMTLNSSGNLGLGVTPSAWSASAKSFDINAGSLYAFSANIALAVNGFFDTGWKYKGSGNATLYNQSSGQHEWYTAPSGTAGNAISFTQAMTLDASGRLGIGTPNPAYKLQVAGSSSNNNNTANVIVVDGAEHSRLKINASTAGGFQASLVLSSGEALSSTTNEVSISTAGSQEMRFATAGTERMRINSSGNLGLGVTPSAWFSGITALQFGTAGVLWSNSDRANLASNVYIDSSTNARYINNGFALRYAQESGEHRWSSAVSGTAGNAITFTQAMTLDASGNLGVGTPSPSNRIQSRRDATTDSSNAQFVAETRTGTVGQYAIYSSRFDNGSGSGFTPVAFGAVQTAAAGRTGDFIIAVSNTDNVNLSTHERMRITSGGNVLVGTTTDNGARLQVSGAATFSSSVQSSNLLVNTTSNDGYISVNGNNSSRVFYGQGGATIPSGNSLFRLDARGVTVFQILGSGAATFSSTIQTAAPTGGTARAWKLGDAFVSTPGSATHEIEVEINGTTYLVPARELIV